MEDMEGGLELSEWIPEVFGGGIEGTWTDTVSPQPSVTARAGGTSGLLLLCSPEPRLGFYGQACCTSQQRGVEWEGRGTAWESERLVFSSNSTTHQLSYVRQIA